ncbi:MAG: hypothetical protein C5B54_05385 [Acidobacteria bacterium]|nr:MAG: hypothetical protein C5B54_05385 [Acidobacteriota bacterium]
MQGRRLSFKEKVGILILRPKLRHAIKESKNPGNTALIFGVIGAAALVIGIFVGPVLILSLVAAILAVVLGSSAKKKNPSDSKARAATILGWITLGLIAVLFLAAAIYFASGAWLY